VHPANGRIIFNFQLPIFNKFSIFQYSNKNQYLIIAQIPPLVNLDKTILMVLNKFTMEKCSCGQKLGPNEGHLHIENGDFVAQTPPEEAYRDENRL